MGLTARARRGERGAILVEAILVIPVLFFLIFGAIEAGGVLKSYSTVANTVRAGGRMASVQGSTASADQMSILRMAEESTALSDGEIEYIIVWHASSTSDSVPAACLSAAESAADAPNSSSIGVQWTTGSSGGSCNVYMRPQGSNGAFDMAAGRATNSDPMYYFGCTGPADPAAAHKLDCRWPPQTRRTTVAPRSTTLGQPQPDRVGIYMRIEHEYLTGLLGDVRTITDQSITLLEPDSFGTT